MITHIRAYHNRSVEVYNERLDRWEPEALFDLAACVSLPVTLFTDLDGLYVLLAGIGAVFATAATLVLLPSTFSPLRK